MPKINVSADEKRILMHYINHPLAYVKNEYHRYFPDGLCPEHTKVTRTLSDEGHIFERCFMIPVSGSRFSHITIVLSHIDQDDPLEHSCTFVGQKYFFYQNEKDLPKIVPKDIEPDSDISDNESDDEETRAQRERYRQFQNDLHRLRVENATKKNYLKVGEVGAEPHRVVKYAVDENDHDYIVKITSSYVNEYIPIRSPIFEKPNHFRFFRKMWCGGFRTKCIDIMPNYGPDLFEFYQEHSMSNSMIDRLVRALLEQFIQQVNVLGIVHTDIKSANICVQMIDDEITIHFIDFDDAFVIGSSPELCKGKGSVGYYAPELFINPQDGLRQLELRSQGEEQLVKALKPNFSALFTQSTDIYALGQCILRDLHLSHDSSYYALAEHMCDQDPATRATVQHIKSALHSPENLNVLTQL